MDSPTIRELKAELQGAQLHSAVQKFWQAATQSGTPLLEGSATTFLWRGAVQERPLLLANKFTGGYPVEQLRFNHLPGTDVHWLSLAVPAELLSTYSIGFVGSEVPVADSVAWREERAKRAGLRLSPAEASALRAVHSNARPDPLARGSGTQLDAFWPASILAMPQAPDLTFINNAPAGELRELRTGSGRKLHVLLPDSYRQTGDEHPLLLMTDAAYWLRGEVLQRTLAGWDVVAVLVDQGSNEQRISDLTPRSNFLEEVCTEILPLVRHSFNVSTEPGRTVFAGQSLGGLTAAYAVLARPDLFGLALCQSGSFWWPTNRDTGQALEWLTQVTSRFSRAERRFHLIVGDQEWTLTGPTERFARALTDSGIAVETEQFAGGHDDLCWLAQLPGALDRLLAG